MTDSIISPSTRDITLVSASSPRMNGNYHYHDMPALESRQKFAARNQQDIRTAPYIEYAAVVSPGNRETQESLAESLAWNTPVEKSAAFRDMAGVGFEIEHHPDQFNSKAGTRIYRIRQTLGDISTTQMDAIVKDLNRKSEFTGQSVLEDCRHAHQAPPTSDGMSEMA